MSEPVELNLRLLLEHAHIGVVIHTWDTSIVYANPTALRLLRLTYKQIIGKDAYDPHWTFLDDNGNPLAVEDYPVNKVKRTQSRIDNEVMGVIDSSCEHISWFMINAYFQGDEHDKNRFIVVTFNDISDSKHLFSFQDIVENIQDVVIVTKADNLDYPLGPEIVYVNKAFEKLTGYTTDEVIGETPRLLQGDLTDETAKNRIRDAITNQQAITETLLNYDVKGRPYWTEMNIIPLKNKYGVVTHFAAMQRDVSERKYHQEQLEKRNRDLKALKENLEELVEQRTEELRKAKSKLEKIAFFDPLTNIPNRRFFIDQSNKLISAARRQKTNIAFALLDIDNFKVINDSHGHDVGDKVLINVADITNRFFRAEDAFCRYGGEEFAFALLVDKPEKVESIAARILADMRDIKIELGNDQSISVTASLGISICTPDKKTDLEQQLKVADKALYEAKKSGKDRFVIYQ